MNLLITGIAGFIGSKIAQAAIDKGFKVFGIDDLSQGKLSNVPIGSEFLELNLINPENLKKIPHNINYILHLAGQSSGEISFDNPVLDLEKNSISTLNLIKFGIENKVKKIIYASSMSVYGTTEDKPISEDNICAPLSCYGVGKLAAENYLKIYSNQLPFTAFRMFNVYGPGQDMDNLRQGMVSIYLAHIIQKKHIPIKGKIDRYRDFIFINDVVDVWLKSIELENTNNKTFNLGTGVRTTVSELLLKLQKIIPDFTWEEIENTRGDQFGIYANTNELKKIFHIDQFTALEEGLDIFIKWINQQHI